VIWSGGETNREDPMPKRKEKEHYAELGQKEYWHTYGLQILSTPKFAKVVTNILSGRYSLITAKIYGRPNTWTH
ncbi:MAG: hypothetical protein ACREBV_04645, partial [Candidatus Zixiibacteriota bacterium]